MATIIDSHSSWLGVHALCFISNVYKQRFFKLVTFFENLSNSTSPFEKLKQHQHTNKQQKTSKVWFQPKQLIE